MCLFISSCQQLQYEPLVVLVTVLNHAICKKKKKTGVISNAKQVASSHEIAREFLQLPALIENPQLCPLEAGENPGPPALIDSPDLRNSWGFPLKAGCSTGIRYFTGHCCSTTLIQAKSFDIKINVAICCEQGRTDLQMHVHEWFQ